MPQTGTGWTQYHDFLMQQAIAMMAEPDWANNQALMAQLTPIQDELRAAGASLGENNADVKALFDQFQDAYKAGVAQNETRYGQLLADNQGQTPTIYNATTGQWEQNPNYQAPLSYNQRIDALTGAGGVYDQAQQRYDQTAGNFQDAFTGQNGILSRYDTRANDLGNQVQGVTGALSGAMSGISGDYAQREQQLQGLLQGYGDIQRQDLNRSYDTAWQEQLARLGQSGLANSTVLSSVRGGLETQKARDQARMEDQLRREQLGYQSQWSQDTLGARGNEAMANAQYGMQGIGMRGQYSGDALNASQGYQQQRADLGSQAAGYAANVADVRNQLTADPLRAIEARTDISPSLSDVYNAALNVGTSQSTQFALPGMAPTSYYQQQQPN